MPIYEYACTSCGHRFDKKQRFSDEPVAECPECGSKVQRVLHPAGIIFKGSGFYITDNRKSNGSNGTSNGASSHESTTTASSSSSDS